MEIKKVARFYNVSAGDAFCFDDCIWTYANDQKTDIGMIYLKALRLPFDMTDHGFAPNGFQVYDELETLSGIKITQVKGNSKEELKKNVLKSLEEKHRILISIEGNCCPWDWRYGEKDFAGGHSFFLCEADEQKKEFIGVDPYYDISEVRLPYSCFDKGVTDAKEFSYKKRKEWTKDGIVKAIVDEKKEWNACHDRLKMLGANIGRMIEESLKEALMSGAFNGSYESMSQNPIYQIFETMSNDRIRFVWFLTYLSKKGIRITDECTEAFVDSSKMWGTLKKMLVKGVIRGKIDSQGIEDKINGIIELEKDALEKVLLAMDGKDQEESKGQTPRKEMDYEVEFIPYDLSGFYNNVGFSSHDNADFSGLGEVIDESSLPIGKEISYKDIPLVMYKSDTSYDNMVCKKQTIELPTNNYTKLCLLACTDWEEYKDIFELQYEDGSKKNAPVDIAGWMPDRNNKPDNICITAKKNIQRSRSAYEKCYFYCYELKCNQNKQLKAIRLPNNENIHVMALTLVERKENIKNREMA